MKNSESKPGRTAKRQMQVTPTASVAVSVEPNLYTHQTLLSFTQWLSEKRAQDGNSSIGKKYLSVVNAFLGYIEKPDILLKSITAKVVDKYRAQFIASGFANSYLQWHLRTLNTIFGLAMKHGLVKKESPFRNCLEKQTKYVRKGGHLTLDEIRRLRKMDLGTDKTLNFARDAFMVAFFCGGLTFIEMLTLRRGADSALEYTEAFSGTKATIAETGELARILKKYGETGSIVPLDSDLNPISSKVDTIRRMTSRGLKRLGEMLGLDFTLTMSAAKDSVNAISRQMLLETAVIGAERSKPGL